MRNKWVTFWRKRRFKKKMNERFIRLIKNVKEVEKRGEKIPATIKFVRSVWTEEGKCRVHGYDVILVFPFAGKPRLLIFLKDHLLYENRWRESQKVPKTVRKDVVDSLFQFYEENEEMLMTRMERDFAKLKQERRYKGQVEEMQKWIK